MNTKKSKKINKNKSTTNRKTKYSMKGGLNCRALFDDYKFFTPIHTNNEIIYDYSQILKGLDMFSKFVMSKLVSSNNNFKNSNKSEIESALTDYKGSNNTLLRRSKKEQPPFILLSSILKKLCLKDDYFNFDEALKISISNSFKYSIEECNLILNGRRNIKNGSSEYRFIVNKNNNGKTVKRKETYQISIPIIELFQNAWDSNLLSCTTLDELKKKYIKVRLYRTKNINKTEFPTIEVINKGKTFPFDDTTYHTYEELKSTFKSKYEGGPKDVEHKIGLYTIFGGRTLGLQNINSNGNFRILFRNNEEGESVVSLSRITPIGESGDDNN